MGLGLSKALFIAELFLAVVVDLALHEREEQSRCFSGTEGSVDELEVLFVFHGIESE